MGLVTGYLCAAGAVVGFGSNFVPVKMYDTGDGVFFQFMMCVAIWLVGLAAGVAAGSPEFCPLAMVGGVLWCTGNIMSVPCINRIGLSLGLLIWGSTNMVVGWASGSFGLFGLTRDVIAKPALNYAGVLCVLASLAMNTQVRPTRGKDGGSGGTPSLGSLDRALLDDDHYLAAVDEGNEAPPSSSDDDAPLMNNAVRRRHIGVALAVISGVLYGLNLDPPQLVADRHGSGPKARAVTYVSSHFCGILLTSTVYFAAYCAYMTTKGLKPDVRPELVLPALASGLIWAVADLCWFIANDALSFVVSFPLVTSGPGFVGALWGVYVYSEIDGTRNLSFLAAGFALLVLAATLIVLSR